MKISKTRPKTRPTTTYTLKNPWKIKGLVSHGGAEENCTPVRKAKVQKHLQVYLVKDCPKK